jgi:hypothetical protein
MYTPISTLAPNQTWAARIVPCSSVTQSTNILHRVYSIVLLWSRRVLTQEQI